MYKFFFKRGVDFFLATLFLVLFSPIFFLVLICLMVVNNGKPFFFQIRPGKNEKLFKIIKFKTMTDKKDRDGELLPDKDRLTSIGIFVRKTSLDEIPQLINVLIGNMSLIGPRPLLPEYLPLYTEKQSKRHLVKPGITGWAQVNGRNAISWEKKFEYDIWYVEHLSFILDIKIILKTIKKVIVSEGVNTEGQATTEKFKG